VIVERAPNNLYLSDKVLRLDLPAKDKEWLLWFFRSPGGRRSLEGMSTGNQLSMRNISQQALRDIQIPFPPEKERQEIIRRVKATMTELDKLEIERKRASQLLDHLEQACLAKALRGKLVPQDLNDEPAHVLLERIRASRTAQTAAARSRGPVTVVRRTNRLSRAGARRTQSARAGD
jgi:type I restriction enzyme S subunit